MTISVLFGVRSATLDEARALVEKALGIVFEERESLHHGGRYFAFGKPGLRDLILQENVDLLDDEPAEPNFTNYGHLLYLDAATERSSFLTALQGAPELFVTLRTKVR